MQDHYVNRTYTAALFVVAAAFFGQMACSLRAQDTPAPAKPARETHLEEVKWNTASKKLIAVVTDGRVEAGKYIPEKITDYEIDLAKGTVSVDNEQEQFSRYEGELIWRMVDLVVNYAAESVLWYDATHKPAPKQEAKR